MKIEFRKANLDDLEDIINLCNECFEENTSIEYAKKVFLESINDNKQIYIIGIVDGKIVAHTKITIIPTIYGVMQTYSILNHVCVKPSYRRHNLATLMLQECEKISKEMNCVKMELWSNNFRVAAHECYKKYGFAIDDAKFFSKEIN